MFRLRKCYGQGMRPDCVEPAHVIAEKLEKKRRQEEEEEERNIAKRSRTALPPLDRRPLNNDETSLVILDSDWLINTKLISDWFTQIILDSDWSTQHNSDL